MPARQSMTPSCPSSLGPSLRTVSQALDLPAERKEERMWVDVCIETNNYCQKVNLGSLLEFI